MVKAVPSSRKGIIGLGVLFMLALLAGLALMVSNDAEGIREEAADATSLSLTTETSDSSGALPTSAPSAEPAAPEPVIPRTEPATSGTGTCETSDQDPGTDQRRVIVYFHCDVPDQQGGRNVAPVHRLVVNSPAVLETALGELLAGPSEAERATGFYSPFSAGTSGLLRSVAIDDEGVARIDFANTFRRIDNVGTTNVSSQIYQELNETVFQFDTVSAIVYTLEGSDEAWCELHGAECGQVRRQT